MSTRTALCGQVPSGVTDPSAFIFAPFTVALWTKASKVQNRIFER